MKSATAAASIRQAPRTAQSPESPSMAAKRGVAATAQSSVARSASFLARSKSSGAMGLAGTVLAVVSDGFFFTQREMTKITTSAPSTRQTVGMTQATRLN